MANTNVFAFAESRGGELRRAALEAVTAARGVADSTGGQVHAMVAARRNRRQRGRRKNSRR